MKKRAMMRKLAIQAIRVPVKDRWEFIKSQCEILAEAWNKDASKLEDFLINDIQDIAGALVTMETLKEHHYNRFHFDRIKLGSNGQYIAHEGVNEPEERQRQEHSSLTAQERRDAHQIFVVMSVYDDEICEEYQSQDEADIAASRFTRAVVIRRYTRMNGLEAEDWTYGPLW